MKFLEFSGFRVLLICFACLFFLLLFQSLVPLLPDVSYILAADGRFLKGDVPYTDILEINPPLVFWVTLPPIWLAGVLDISTQVVFVAYVCLIIAGSVLLAAKLLRSGGEMGASGERLLVIMTVVMTLGSAWGFGQREHLAMLLVLPYATSVVMRVNGREAGFGLRGLAGFLAGMGLDFKPYFLAIPILVEGFLLMQSWNWRGVLRVETLVMAFVVLVYPALVWCIYPQYFSEIVPLVRLTYGAYQVPFADIAQRQIVLSFGFLFVMTSVLLFWQGVGQRGNLVWLCAALGGLAGYLVQGKGWPYQLLPGMIFVSIAFLSAASQAPYRLLRCLAYGYFGVVSGFGIVEYGLEQRARVSFFDGLLETRAPKRMLVMTHDAGVVFPFLPGKGIAWGGHFLSLWMMPAVSRGLVDAPQAEAVTARTAAIVAQDLVRFQPDYVIVDHRAESTSLRGHDIKYVELFSRTGAFASAWQSYKLVNTKDNFELWEWQEAK